MGILKDAAEIAVILEHHVPPSSEFDINDGLWDSIHKTNYNDRAQGIQRGIDQLQQDMSELETKLVNPDEDQDTFVVEDLVRYGEQQVILYLLYRMQETYFNEDVYYEK